MVINTTSITEIEKSLSEYFDIKIDELYQHIKIIIDKSFVNKILDMDKFLIGCRIYKGCMSIRS